MTQPKTLFYVIVGMKEEPDLPEESNQARKREKGRQAAAGTGSEDDASGGHESNQQSVLTRDTRAQSTATHTQTHTQPHTHMA